MKGLKVKHLYNELGNVKLLTTLHGTVDDARLERAQREHQWRLEQLQPYIKEEKYFVNKDGDAFPVVGGKVRFDL
jgi:hypothetical protein